MKLSDSKLEIIASDLLTLMRTHGIEPGRYGLVAVIEQKNYDALLADFQENVVRQDNTSMILVNGKFADGIQWFVQVMPVISIQSSE